MFFFKATTQPLYFNSQKWQDKRSVLSELAGEITDSVDNGNPIYFKEYFNVKIFNNFK